MNNDKFANIAKHPNKNWPEDYQQSIIEVLKKVKLHTREDSIYQLVNSILLTLAREKQD